MLEQIIVSERDFASTFKNGTALFDDYNYAMALNAKKVKNSLIAGLTQRNPGVIRKWLSREVTPDVIKAVKLAKEKKLIPLKAADPNFQIINYAALWMLFSGYIDNKYGGEFSGSKADLEYLQEQLGTIGIESDFDRPGLDSVLQLKEGGAAFSRICVALGVPYAVDKVKERLEVPRYLKEVASYKSGTDEEKRLATRILQDAINVIFSTRLRPDPRYDFCSIELPRNISKTDADYFGQQVLCFIQQQMPDIPMNYKLLRYNPNKKRIPNSAQTITWQPRINIPKEGVTMIGTNHPYINIPNNNPQ